MTITYTVGSGLYINLTNRCSNNCDFCVRLEHSSVGDADSLWLEREPSREEVWDELLGSDISAFDEIVFCGFGEPTERLDDLLWISGKIKETWPDMPVRVNTNGHASLIAGEDVTGRIAGLVGCLSVSLNYASPEEYLEHCKPEFGIKSHSALLDFAQKAQSHGIKVILSVVNGTTDIASAKECAAKAGLPLRIREYIDKG